MPDAVELELNTIHFATEPLPCADAIVCQRTTDAPRALRVRLSYGDAHQLAHELQQQETPRSHAIALLSEVLECVGGRVASASLSSDGTGTLRGSISVTLPSRSITFGVSPGHAIAVAVRLGVVLLGDEALFGQPTVESTHPGSESINEFLESLDLSGLGS